MSKLRFKEKQNNGGQYMVEIIIALPILRSKRITPLQNTILSL